MLLKEIKIIFHKELGEIYPKEEIDSFFYRCIEHYLKLERFVLVIQPELTLTQEEEQPLFEALAQLKLQKPLQYVLGVAHFMDLELHVDQNVLIPRPETEELVRWILEDFQDDTGLGPDAERSRSVNSTSLNDHSPQILDIGTGSGCIAIALAKHLPNTSVTAIDFSKGALEVAKENAKMNQVDIEFLQLDILQNGMNSRFHSEFDIIVSNPPYVRKLEQEKMQKNVTDYEPHTALFVPDDDALIFYDAITRFAQRHLKSKGSLYFEINQYLGEETKALLKAHDFSEIELRKDMFGNDRMLKATRT